MKIKVNDIGYFIQRPNINSILVDDFIRELENNLFELKIMQLAAQSFQSDRLLDFDALVGDWKCQVRASMIMDLSNRKSAIKLQLSNDFVVFDKILNRTQALLEQIGSYTHIQRQDLRLALKGRYLSDIMKEYQLEYVPSVELCFLSLCYVITRKNLKLPVFFEHRVSINKMKFLINTVKKMLCDRTIKYEREVVAFYGGLEDQIALQQIERQHVQQMTSLFVGFRSILKKMEIKQQSFVIHSTVFCDCGGVQKVEFEYFRFFENEWRKVSIPYDMDESVMVIQAYQYLGSLSKLQTLLRESLSHDPLLGFAAEYLYRCSCSHPTGHNHVESIKKAIMAFFAQHAQFTNGASIDFNGLGLIDSKLKQEYDCLLKLPGHHIYDMSNLWIRHMYAATLQEAVHDYQKQYHEFDTNFNT